MRIFLLFSLMFVGLCGQYAADAQVTGSSAEQDFAFASGLFRDKNYQLAFEEFTAITVRHPGSGLAVDAAYYAAECQYQQGYLTDADIAFRTFVEKHPLGKLADDAIFRRGEIAFRRGDHAAALVQYDRILNDYPDANTAHEAAYWAGESALHLRDFDRARALYTRAYERHPEGRIRDYAAFSIAYVDEQEGRIPQARAGYISFLEQFPASALQPTAKTRIGACAFAEKDYRGTIQWLDSLADSPDPANASERLFLRAEAYYQLGEHLQASRLYSAFLDAYPTHERARAVYYALGWCYLELKKYTEAAVAFDSAALGSPELAEAALFRKGMVLRLDGKAEQSAAIFERLIADRPSGMYADNASFELGMNAFQAERYTDALGRFERVIDRVPRSDVRSDAWFMAGESLMKLRRPAEAAAMFAAAAEDTLDAPVRTNARFRLGHAHFEAGRFALSAAAFASFINSHSGDTRSAEARLWLGEALFHAKRYSEAVQAYSGASQNTREPGLRQDALYGTGWAQYSAGRYREAEATFLSLIDTYRGGRREADALVRLADAQYAQKKFSDAARNYRSAAKKFPKHILTPYALLQQGNAEHRSGDTPAGVATLRSLLASHPGSDVADKAQFSLAWFYFETRDYVKAITEFRALEGSYPNSTLAPQALYAIGDCYYNMGRYADAETAYTRLLTQHPDSRLVPNALDGIAQCRQLAGDPNAERFPEQWLEKNGSAPGADDVLLALARRASTGGDATATRAMLAEFMAKYPESPLRSDAMLLRAEAYREARLYDSARASLTRLLDAGNDAAVLERARFASARIAIDEQDPETALALYDALQQQGLIAHTTAELEFDRGRAHTMNGADDAALAAYAAARAAADEPNFADRGTIEAARILARRGSVDTALALLAPIAASRIDDVGAEAQYRTGDLLANAQRSAEAEKAWLRVGYVYPESAEWSGKALLDLGAMYEARDKGAKAAETYRTLIVKYPGTAAAGEAQNRLARVQ